MPYPNEYSCRIREPVKGAPTRRKNGEREHNGKKYDVIYQEQKGKWVDQAYRYPKKTWSASEARSHCKSHSGTYEGKTNIERVDAMVTSWEGVNMKAYTHNSATADSEPDWGSVDKTALPRAAHADMGEEGKKSTWKYPHHWIKGGAKKDDDGIWTDGTMYLHRGGLNAAWAAAQGARSGQKASSSVISHLQKHRKALGMDDEEEKGEFEGTILYRLSSRIFNTPLAITQDKLSIIMSVLNRRIGIEASTKVLPYYEANRRDVETIKNIALIPVQGTLVNRTMGLEALSGLTSYQSLKTDFLAALDDPEIEYIVLDVDSPGGEVAGLFDFVDMIYNAREKKHITAIADEHAYSAAYAIASAAHEVYTSRTGGTGSIGVIAVHVDQSAYDEKTGLKYTSIYAGSKKNDLSPHQPLSEEVVKDLQTRVDEIYNLFVSTVARNRNITSEQVKSTEADIFLGGKGLDVGLIDDVKTLDEVVNGLTVDGGSNMTEESLKSQLDVLLADAPPEERDSLLAEMGYVPKVEQDTEVAQNEREEYQKEIENLQGEVKSLKDRVTKAETTAGEEKVARREMELRDQIKGYKCVGDVDVLVSTAMTLEEKDPERAEAYLKDLESQGKKLSASGLFSEIGDNSEVERGKEEACKELEGKIEEMKKGGMSDLEARKAAPRQHPKLFKECREGR